MLTAKFWLLNGWRAGPRGVSTRVPIDAFRLLRLVLLSLLWTTCSGAFAQVPKDDAPAALIDDARKEMSDIRSVLKEGAPTDDAALVDARRRALAAQSMSQEAANALAGELT